MLNRILPLAAAAALIAAPAALADPYHGHDDFHRGRGEAALTGVIVGGIVGGAIASSIAHRNAPYCAEHHTYHFHDNAYGHEDHFDHFDHDDHDDHGYRGDDHFQHDSYDDGYHGGGYHGAVGYSRVYGPAEIRGCRTEVRSFRDNYGRFYSKEVRVCY